MLAEEVVLEGADDVHVVLVLEDGAVGEDRREVLASVVAVGQREGEGVVGEELGDHGGRG